MTETWRGIQRAEREPKGEPSHMRLAELGAPLEYVPSSHSIVLVTTPLFSHLGLNKYIEQRLVGVGTQRLHLAFCRIPSGFESAKHGIVVYIYY